MIFNTNEKVLCCLDFFFRNCQGKLKLRCFVPENYLAESLGKTVSLDTYVSEHLKGNPIGLVHKHWFTPKEWIKMLEKSRFQFLAHEGLFYLYMIAGKFA